METQIGLQGTEITEKGSRRAFDYIRAFHVVMSSGNAYNKTG